MPSAAGLPAHDFEGDTRVLDGDGDGEPRVDMCVDEVQLRVYPPLVVRSHQAKMAVRPLLAVDAVMSKLA